MLKAIYSENFNAEPCYYKEKLHLSRTKDRNYSLIFINEWEIDELIELLENAKKEFKK